MENNMQLIDSNALMRVPNVRKVVEYDEAGYGITYHAVPVVAIKKAPVVDAVVVVRCKDCKYARDGHSERYVLCTAHETFLHYSPADGYCYRGKKMDRGADDAI